MRARRSQRTGSDFELVVAGRLRVLGVACVEQVATPMVKIRGVWVRGRKVSCDIKGIIPPTGRALQVECKLRPGGRLLWSDLQDHQHTRLRECIDAGGLAVIAFSDGHNGIEFIDYALALQQGWEPGESLDGTARVIAAAIYWPRFKDQGAMH
jgi:hypothetical protein